MGLAAAAAEVMVHGVIFVKDRQRKDFSKVSQSFGIKKQGLVLPTLGSSGQNVRKQCK